MIAVECVGARELRDSDRDKLNCLLKREERFSFSVCIVVIFRFAFFLFLFLIPIDGLCSDAHCLLWDRLSRM